MTGLVPYPGDEFAEYNAKLAQESWRAGHFAIAVDVWRDGEHLWRSYALELAESMDSWCARNFPEVANPDYKNTVMGVLGAVPNIDRYPVPMKAALGFSTSLPEVGTILRATLGIAQLPHKPEKLDIVPTSNTMRQRMHQSETDWSVFNIVDQENRIVIRVVLAKVEEDQPYLAEYEAHLYRAGEGESHLDDRKVTIEYEKADLTSPKSRKMLTQAAKSRLNIVGMHSICEHADDIKYRSRVTGHPFVYEIRFLKATHIPREVSGGFDH